MAARLNGDVAQLGEHLPCKQGVMSSNLTISIPVCNRPVITYLENCILIIYDTNRNVNVRHPRNCKQPEAVTLDSGRSE